ncbi:uncharacterized protein LOC127534707 isoform X1 [Acanthochromis polyacanthus]|uniref:uncharacterized protein LOC127534707 isoform X1 n=1 Tax=Acanthochromis polyacanthus TaxID=80966 RepID=UPI00223444AB|nr:uncharacterized protein LOC127534707 isoform X1 [Acanthochromis polyacanthus]
MSKYITDLQVSLNETEESQLRAQGFIKSDVDLNKGAGGKNIYLWYKRGDSGAITRIEFSFNDDISEALNKAGYQKIPKNLSTRAGENPVYLWFFKGSSEDHAPIMYLGGSYDDESQDRGVSTVSEAQKSHCTTLSCDLNQDAGRCLLTLWLITPWPTYICDIVATVNNEGDHYYWYNGYIRVGVDTNTGAGGDSIYIWYRKTNRPEEAIRDLQVSTNYAEYDNFMKQGYKLANINLNKGTGGNPVFLWYKKDGSSDPIKDITVIAFNNTDYKCRNKPVEVIQKNLNEGVKDASKLFLCYYH